MDQSEHHFGVYTVPEFATKYRASRASVYNWFAAGLLGSVKIGGCRRILPEHEKAFLTKIKGFGTDQ